MKNMKLFFVNTGSRSMADIHLTASIFTGRPNIQALPNEIWRAIMLFDASVYCALALVCKAFRVDAEIAKTLMIRKKYLLGRHTLKLPCGLLHSINDQPALIEPDGSQFWCIDGKLHRIGGPAIMWADGTQTWYIDGNRV